MDNKEPTQEQIKELWAWSGIKFKHFKGQGWCWYNKDKQDWYYSMPNLTLDNLFKYAIPKIPTHDSIAFYEGSDKKWLCCIDLFDKEVSNQDNRADTPELALFWAIYEIIKSDKEDVK